ncbi:MAG TPA: peptidylprolyl isomerase, partial [Bacteroidales bacterium]|nr:peptidylprolyl isomerase [Bacteroidales bacterium]
QQVDIYKTLGGTPHLDGAYTVFGEITEGLDVIDKIASVKTLPGDKPAKELKMTIQIVE